MIWRVTKVTSNKWEAQVIYILRQKLQEIYARNSGEIDFGWLYFFTKKVILNPCSQPIAKGLSVGYINFRLKPKGQIKRQTFHVPNVTPI